MFKNVSSEKCPIADLKNFMGENYMKKLTTGRYAVQKIQSDVCTTLTVFPSRFCKFGSAPLSSNIFVISGHLEIIRGVCPLEIYRPFTSKDLTIFDIL